MSFVDDVIAVLVDSGSAMHVDEIAEQMAPPRADPEIIVALSSRISTALSAHVQTASSRVKRLPNGNGGYRKGIYKAKVSTTRAPALPCPNVKEISSNYVGKAGEHAVMSELLFWGFNVSLMAVDEGIDVIATKENKYFHIQVKTTGGLNAQGGFSFGIERKKFERNNSAHTFYILVMRDRSMTRYVVLPSAEIGRLIGRGLISGVNNLSLKISVDPATKNYVLNGSENVQNWINGFQFVR